MRHTSIAANNHAESSGLKIEHRQIILDTLVRIGEGTALAISERTTPHIDYMAVARRMKELEVAHLVFSDGTSNHSPSKRKASVWKLILKQGKMFE